MLPEKYWQQPPGNIEDVVIIHVCDENRQVNRDFCCKRDILVKHMKYFESFLAENENGYDDIDISVHCDVEIFEWLMAYIHAPDIPPPLEKSIVVSILISSEFLQMDSLVDVCLEHIASSLGDIIRLPIDLSCISEKLINRLAALTQPKTLAITRDRKDKVLNKLYKRRVELDFSRKNVPRGGNRSIAASLTCCQFCGGVYLDNCVSSLICKASKAAVDFRGRLVRRHQAIPGWSLTAYLKALHAGGMPWEAIYWHVWGACEVFQVDDVSISALDTDRYSIESDGILIKQRASTENSTSNIDQMISNLSITDPSNSSSNTNKTSHTHGFSLEIEDDLSTHNKPLKLLVTASPYDTLSSLDSHITPSLNPARPPTILTNEIFELLTSQCKAISGVAYKQLFETTGKAQISEASSQEEAQAVPLIDFYDILWGDYGGNAGEIIDNGLDENTRGRSHSPVPRPQQQKESNRRQAHSIGTSKVRNENNEENGVSGNGNANGNGNGNGNGSDNPGSTRDRRSRSSSMGTRRNGKSLVRKKSARRKGDNTIGEIDVEALEKEISRMLEVFHSYPPDLQRLFKSLKGPIYSVWTVPHPLQLHPNLYHDSIASIQDTTISEAKKLEWELDLTRDYDEKRLDRIESFLISCRDNTIDAKKKPVSDKFKLKRKEEDKGFGKLEYYRDKGRQPHRC